MPPQLLEVSDEMRRRVVSQLAERCRAASAALVIHDDAVGGGVEEAAMLRRGTGSRPSVEEYDGDAVRIPRRLPIHRVNRVEPQTSRSIRFDLRIELGTDVGRGHRLRPQNARARRLARLEVA